MKRIELLTNYNNKLSTTKFIHLGKAPDIEITPDMLNQLYEMHTKDGSHPPVTVRLFGIDVMKMVNLKDWHTVPSHGLIAVDFVDWYMRQFPDADWNYPLAVYFYHVENR